MLYLESSALVKHYIFESATNSLNSRVAIEEAAGLPLFTSVLSFAEVQHAFARKLKEKAISPAAFNQAKRNFESDWVDELTLIDLGSNVLGFVPEILERTNLKSSDAVQMASALWLRDLFRLGSKHGPKGSQVVFTTCDSALEQTASTYNLGIFNPETTQFP